MTRPSLEIFLPVFLLLFLVVFLAWSFTFHKRILKNKKSYLPPLTRINHFFQIMIVLAALIVGLYSFYPEYYILLIPIDSLDKPLINDIGGFILRVAFFWLLSSMLHTFLLFRTIQKEKQKKPIQVYVYAQKMVLVSVALMLVGLAVTISSIGAFLLSLGGLFFYYRIYHQTTSIQ